MLCAEFDWIDSVVLEKKEMWNVYDNDDDYDGNEDDERHRKYCD